VFAGFVAAEVGLLPCCSSVLPLLASLSLGVGLDGCVGVCDSVGVWVGVCDWVVGADVGDGDVSGEVGVVVGDGDTLGLLEAVGDGLAVEQLVADGVG
jgi:hypothetical protein